jgi:putative transcriptional regulator
LIDLAFKNSKKPKIGNVLISDPFLDEDYFRRSVVLLCDHNAEGSFGFVLNNYLDIDLHEVDDSFPDIKARISVGGPVETQSLFFIHSFGDEVEGGIPINNELSFGGDYEQIQDLIELDPSNGNKIRFFLGYSGWTSLQLESEIKNKSWIPWCNKHKNKLLKKSSIDFWKQKMNELGGEYKIWSNAPEDPILN